MSEKEQELFEEIEKLEEQIKEKPKDIELYLKLGDLCFYSRNNKVYKKGMRAFMEAFSLNPSSYVATRIADTYDYSDKMACAYRYRLKAIKLEPNDPYHYVYLFDTLKYYIELIEHYSPDDKDTPKKKKKALEKLEKYEAMAIEHYKKAFALNPSSQIATKIADIYESNDKMAYAYRYRLKAIKLDPNNLDNYIELFGTLKYYIDFSEDYDPDNKDAPKKVENISKKLKKYQLKAIEVAKELLKTEPNDYGVLCKLYDLYREEDEDKALDYLQRAFEIDKEDGQAYYWLKCFYERKKDYKKLIELHLSMGEYYENGESCKDKIKDYKKAIECYKKAFSLNPSSQIATKIAYIYEYDDKMVCTYKYRLKAIKLEPNNLDNYIELFDTLNYYTELTFHYPDDKDLPKKVEKVPEKLKKYKLKAIPVAKEKLKENPNDYDVLCCLCDLYREDDIDKALDYGERAFEIDKEDDEAYYSLMYLYRKKEDYKKLIELYLTIGHYYQAGNVYELDLKDYHKAIECYKKAFALNPSSQIASKIADIYDSIDKIACAYRYRLKAIKLSPNDLNLYLDLYDTLGNYRQLLRKYESADTYTLKDKKVFNKIKKYHEISMKKVNELLKINPKDSDVLNYLYEVLID